MQKLDSRDVLVLLYRTPVDTGRIAEPRAPWVAVAYETTYEKPRHLARIEEPSVRFEADRHCDERLAVIYSRGRKQISSYSQSTGL